MTKTTRLQVSALEAGAANPELRATGALWYLIEGVFLIGLAGGGNGTPTLGPASAGAALLYRPAPKSDLQEETQRRRISHAE